MENDDKKLADEKIKILVDRLEEAQEQKLVNLMIEIIISITLKQLYEESD